MAIFDCFQYFNEDHIADLRFNILDEFINKFVIVESTIDHQGKPKKLHFDINRYKKFKNKINYIVVDDTPEEIKKNHEGGESLVEQHQRNSIMKGLKNANDNDLIILYKKGIINFAILTLILLKNIKRFLLFRECCYSNFFTFNYG